MIYILVFRGIRDEQPAKSSQSQKSRGRSPSSEKKSSEKK